jgi:hypothetical protein
MARGATVLIVDGHQPVVQTRRCAPAKAVRCVILKAGLVSAELSAQLGRG